MPLVVLVLSSLIIRVFTLMYLYNFIVQSRKYNNTRGTKLGSVASRVFALDLMAALAGIVYGTALCRYFATDVNGTQIAFLLSSLLTLGFVADAIIMTFTILKIVSPLIENRISSIPGRFWKQFNLSVAILIAEFVIILIILTQIRNV